MLASFKLLLTVLCVFCTFYLYTDHHFSASSFDNAASPLTTPDVIIFDSQPQTSTPLVTPPSELSSAPKGIVPQTENHKSNVSEYKRPRILQATMIFGGTFIGFNERTLQSHVDHAERWGYGDRVLRREIVGVGQWDKFIFSKVLHVLDLIIGELKRPKGERAEWVVWYDADTLILNPNVHWELFLPPDELSDVHFMATKNLDGFNAGLFFILVDEWSVELLSDAYSLRRLKPEIEISGNIEQNALQYLFGLQPNKKHIIYQPQLWYNGFKGDSRAETEINEGDMLVHFAGVNHDYEGEKKNELMGQWFEKIEKQPDKWQVPLEKTKYPGEIKAFWRAYKEAKEMLESVYGRADVPSGPHQDLEHAKDELKWAIEELAYDGAHLKKCMEEMAQALKAADNAQVSANDHAGQQAVESGKAPNGSAVGGSSRFSDAQDQLATGDEVKTKTSDVG